MFPVHSKPPTHTAAAIDGRIDAIARRQSARFLDRLRQAGECTPNLERDFMRAVRFMFDDIKAVLHELPQKADNAHSPYA